MPDDQRFDSKGQIPTNLRLLVVIEEVVRAGVPVTPSAVNEALGLPKPTIHRLFATAEAQGYLQRDLDGRSYGPGPRLRRLAVDTMSSERVRALRLTVLRAVADEVGETCNLAIPDREGMFYLDRVETHWPLRIQLPIGTQVPFHCTASGKMYLAMLRSDYLDRMIQNMTLTARTPMSITDPETLRREIEIARENGFSTDNEEFMEGMTAIAVPIHDQRGRMLATLSVHAPLQRNDIEGLKRHLNTLLSAAKELSAIAAE